MDLILVKADAALRSISEDRKHEVLSKLKDIKALWEETAIYITHCHRWDRHTLGCVEAAVSSSAFIKCFLLLSAAWIVDSNSLLILVPWAFWVLCGERGSVRPQCSAFTTWPTRLLVWNDEFGQAQEIQNIPSPKQRGPEIWIQTLWSQSKLKLLRALCTALKAFWYCCPLLPSSFHPALLSCSSQQPHWVGLAALERVPESPRWVLHMDSQHEGDLGAWHWVAAWLKGEAVAAEPCSGFAEWCPESVSPAGKAAGGSCFVVQQDRGPQRWRGCSEENEGGIWRNQTRSSGTYKEEEVFKFLQSLVFATCSLTDGAYLVGLPKEAELRSPVLSASGLFETIIKSQDELLSWGDVNWDGSYMVLYSVLL